MAREILPVSPGDPLPLSDKDVPHADKVLGVFSRGNIRGLSSWLRTWHMGKLRPREARAHSRAEVGWGHTDTRVSLLIQYPLPLGSQVSIRGSEHLWLAGTLRAQDSEVGTALERQAQGVSSRTSPGLSLHVCKLDVERRTCATGPAVGGAWPREATVMVLGFTSEERPRCPCPPNPSLCSSRMACAVTVSGNHRGPRPLRPVSVSPLPLAGPRHVCHPLPAPPPCGAGFFLDWGFSRQRCLIGTLLPAQPWKEFI